MRTAVKSMHVSSRYRQVLHDFQVCKANERAGGSQLSMYTVLYTASSLATKGEQDGASGDIPERHHVGSQI